MTGKSSWVPSRTQGLFSHCCRWHCVSWVLQELLLSRCGWGVSLGQASLLIPILAFVDRDPTWHCIKLCWKLYFELICFRFIYQTRFVITFIRTLMMKSVCELYVKCGMYVESCTILVVVIVYRDPSWYSMDYQVYMGSSMTVRPLAGCHCTCTLINWSVLRQLAS